MRFIRFHGRAEAARRLIPLIRRALGPKDRAIVVSVPRGGVPVGVTIARSLGLRHGIVVARRITEQAHPEWSVGAVTSSGMTVWNEQRRRKENQTYLDAARKVELAEARRRLRYFGGSGRMPKVAGKTVVLADDGIARGLTLLAATKMLLAAGALKVIIVTPVCSHEGKRLLTTSKSQVLAYYIPKHFKAVGNYYHWFAQVKDASVRKWLKRAG